jgi:hypothetical protein
MFLLSFHQLQCEMKKADDESLHYFLQKLIQEYNKTQTILMNMTYNSNEYNEKKWDYNLGRLSSYTDTIESFNETFYQPYLSDAEHPMMGCD